MQNIDYQMIFKRKSFHTFKKVIPLEEREILEIEEALKNLIPLFGGIEVSFKLVRKEETNAKRGEYCVLIYSQIKPGFLQNVGYMGEQLDLWCAKKNIGVCWYGFGKTNEKKINDQDFVIMLILGKTEEQFFRKDYKKAKRKELSSVWNQKGDFMMLEDLKIAPSACNSEPWYFEGQDNILEVYRVRGKRGIVPADKLTGANRIDLGIMLLFLESYFLDQNIVYERSMFEDDPSENEKALAPNDKVLNARYTIKKG